MSKSRREFLKTTALFGSVASGFGVGTIAKLAEARRGAFYTTMATSIVITILKILSTAHAFNAIPPVP